MLEFGETGSFVRQIEEREKSSTSQAYTHPTLSP